MIITRWGARFGKTRYSTRFTRYDTSFWYKVIYKLRYKIYKLYRSYLQASSKFWIVGWNTKGTSGWCRGW